MADDNLDLKLNVDVSVHELDRIKALRQEFELLEREITKMARDIQMAANPLASLARARGQLNAETAKGGRESLDLDRQLYADLKKRFSFEKRMISQRKSEESDAAKQIRDEQAETARQFRQQMAFNTRMARQRAQAEAEAERETRSEILSTSRMRDRENKKAIADAKALQRAQEKAAAGVSRGAGQVRSGTGRAVTTGGAAAAVVGYGAKRAVDVLTRSGVSIDSAINKNTRLSGQNPRDAERDGAEIRARSMPIARSLGIRTGEYLAARAEAIQAGVEGELVDAVTEYGSKYARLNDMAPSEVMESAGYGITALGAFGKVTADKVKELFATQQHLAATTAASRQGLNAFVRRGLSAGAAAGFSVQDTLAYGGAATSSGADGESAARMLSSTTERLASLPTRAAGIARRKHRTPKDNLFLSLPRKLGFNSWAEVKAAFSKDSAGTIEKIYEGLAAVQDPRARLELSEEIWGKEFGSVHAAMAVGHRFRAMRESVRSPNAGRAIDSGMSVRAGSFDFIMGQIDASVQDLRDGLGLTLKPLWRDLRDYALQAPAAFKQFDDAMRMGLRGFMQGLGSRDGTMAGLIRQWIGDPGAFKLNVYAINDFMRGAGQGLRDIGSAISSFIRLFAGQNAGPQEIGRWTTRILGLSAALLVAAPAVAVLTGLGTAISGFAGIVISSYGLMKAAGLVGGAAGAAKAPLGAGEAASAGLLARFGSLLRMFGGGIGFNATAGLPKADQDALIGRLGAYAQELEKNQQNGSGQWVDPPMRRPVEQLRERVEQNTKALQEGARIQKQSFDAMQDWRGLIHKASINTAAGSIGDEIRGGAARAGSPLSGSVGGGGSPAGEASVSGGSGTRRYGSIGGSGAAQGAGGRAVSGAGNGTMPTSSTAGSLTDLINTEAARAGIDPRILHGIRAGESGKRADYDVKSDSKEDSYGPFQLNRRGGLGATFEKETGLDARDPKTIPAQTRWVAELIKKKGRGILRQWYGYRGDRDADPSWGNSGYVPNSPAGAGGSGTAGAPVTPGQGGQSASRIQGQIDVEGQKFDFGSGGHKGANSIPFGTYPVTPDAIGPWGRANGALGINSNAIWDKTLGRMRTGIEFHAASNARMLTAGCIGIARDQYGAFKEKLLSVYRRSGRAFLTVGPNGASISADRPTDPTGRAVAAQERTKGLGQGAKPDLGGIDVSPQANPGQRAPIGANVPIRPNSGGAGGSAQGGSPVTNHITVNAANHSPDEMASAVQRKLNESMNRRSHDFDQAWA